MNTKKSAYRNQYKSFLLLNEISRDNSLSQRDLSRKLNIALGLVNSYMKNMVARGLVKIRGIPPKRYAYYLTPRGFAEKTRLTFHVLRNYADLYRYARRDFSRVFSTVAAEGKRALIFAGVDDLAEMAFLSLQETDAELVAIVDDESAGSTFLGRKVTPIASLREESFDAVVITSLGRMGEVLSGLKREKVPLENIYFIDGWSTLDDDGVAFHGDA